MGPARRPIVVFLMLLMGCCFAAPAGARQMDQPDATKTYEHIWGDVEDELWEAVSELRMASPAWYPERASSKMLVANQGLVERLIDATRIAPTPAPATEDGWSQTTADTRNYRRTAALLNVDATRLLAEENADGAAGRIAALLRLAKQLGAEPRLSSTTVAASCIQMAEEQVERISRAASLTEAGRRELSIAFIALDPRDPAGFKRGLSGACRLNAWIVRVFKGSEAGEELVQSMPIPEDRKRPLQDGAPEERERGRRGGWGGRRNAGFWPSRELIAEIRTMDGEEIESAVQDFQKMFDEAMELWHEPDAAERLERIDMQAERNAFGPLAKLLPQFFARQRRNAERVDTGMEQIRLSLIAR